MSGELAMFVGSSGCSGSIFVASRQSFTAPEIGSVVFDRDSMGDVIGFGIWAGRVRNVRFTREK